MNIRTIVDTLGIHELKARFDKEVNTSHIIYDWDGGHCYSSINHPIMSEISTKFECINEDAHNEMLDYTNDWLNKNDRCPPCAIYINRRTKEVSSSCGCNNTLTFEEGMDVAREL